MKLSNYNIFVEKNDNVVGFNTMKNNFIVISRNTFNTFNQFADKIDDYKTVNENIYNSLIDNGFIISDQKDELNELRLCNKEYCFNKHYDLTLIPTLDCNLKCWYCWEKHIPNSKMSEDVQDRIRKHIRSELEFNNIDSLKLEWFGGEPLLFFDDVVYPLTLSIKNILEQNNKTFYSSFITNGSLIDENMIIKLKELNAKFQITLDGYKQKHDKVRIKKVNNEGTYEQILKSLYLISDNISDSKINLRINFDDKTLENIEELVYDLKDLDRKKVNIHLERVWQTRKNIENNNTLLQEAILLFTANNFEVEYGNFIHRLSSCKTDRYRQVGINYDGNVYKCSGRPFISSNSDGELSETGEILWNRDRLAQRIGKSTFEIEMCQTCKMLPLCMGPCSQKCMENNWQNLEGQCTLKSFEMSIDEYVIFTFNNVYNINKIKDELSIV